MLGDSILACPVFDEGVREITVKLPKSEHGYRLRGEGNIIEEESTVTVKCTVNDLPVWFTEEIEKNDLTK